MLFDKITLLFIKAFFPAKGSFIHCLSITVTAALIKSTHVNMHVGKAAWLSPQLSPQGNYLCCSNVPFDWAHF